MEETNVNIDTSWLRNKAGECLRFADDCERESRRWFVWWPWERRRFWRHVEYWRGAAKAWDEMADHIELKAGQPRNSSSRLLRPQRLEEKSL